MRINQKSFSLDSYPLGEEIANSITHGVGATLSVAGLVVLLVFSGLYGDVWRIVSFSIYGSSLIILYLASTLYHSFSQPKLKRIFRIFDHSSIYVLIAGTYTPIMLVPMRGAWGWTLFGLIWGLAAGGIVFKAFFTGKCGVLSTMSYMVMGWLILIALKPMLQALPPGMFLWMIGGGLCYTLGIIFFELNKIPYNHTIWHLFVLGGSISHFFGIFFYLTHK